jgi:hypothetical protein
MTKWLAELLNQWLNRRLLLQGEIHEWIFVFVQSSVPAEKKSSTLDIRLLLHMRAQHRRIHR